MYDLAPPLLALVLLTCAAPPLCAQPHYSGEIRTNPSVDSLLSSHHDLEETLRHDLLSQNSPRPSREEALEGARIDPKILVYPDSIVDPAMIHEPEKGVDSGIFLPADTTRFGP